MIELNHIINKFRENRGPSTTAKPPSQSSTVKPTSVSGNLRAESKTEILHADT